MVQDDLKWSWRVEKSKTKSGKVSFVSCLFFKLGVMQQNEWCVQKCMNKEKARMREELHVVLEF